MYANMRSANDAYRSSAAQHAVETSDSYTLISRLLTRLVARLAMARHCIEANDVPGRGEHLGQAIDILGVLQVAIDDQHSQQLAENLVALYDYASRQLLTANLKADVALVNEVDSLIREVKDAWESIREQVSPSAESA